MPNIRGGILKDGVRWSKGQSISTKHIKLGDIHKQQGKMSKSKSLSWKQQGDEDMDVGLCRHTHSRGRGKERLLCQSSQASTLQLPRPVESIKNHYCEQKSFGFPSASLGTGRSHYMWHWGEGRENMNNSQSSERSESSAAAAVQASPTSTSYCFGSRDHTISACFLTSAPSQLLSSCFSACLQEQLPFWKKSRHKEKRLHVPEGSDKHGRPLLSVEAFEHSQHPLTKK